MASAAWVPRSPFERLSNCVFLGRIIDKARRCESGMPVGEYMYGDNDYMDSRVLRFLGTNAANVTDLIRSHADDDVVARKLVERSGKSNRDLRRFNTRMLVMYGLVFAMFDADEGRRRGVGAGTLARLYNSVIYPPFEKKFRRDEDRSKKAARNGADHTK